MTTRRSTAAWRGTLGGFDATQHLVGSVVVDEVTAEHYDAVLRADAGTGWRLVALALHVDWAAGNQQLAVLAAQSEPAGTGKAGS